MQFLDSILASLASRRTVVGMSPARGGPWLALALLASAGCSSTVEGEADAGLDCQASALAWVTTFDGVAAAHGACAVDDECVLIDADLVCTDVVHQTCGLAVARAEGDAARARLAMEGAAICAASAPDCRSSSLCPPDRVARCIDGACR